MRTTKPPLTPWYKKNKQKINKTHIHKFKIYFFSFILFIYFRRLINYVRRAGDLYVAEVLGFLQSDFKREREREYCTSPTSETLRSGKRSAHTSNEIKGSPFGSLFCCVVLYSLSTFFFCFFNRVVLDAIRSNGCDCFWIIRWLLICLGRRAYFHFS